MDDYKHTIATVAIFYLAASAALFALLARS